MKMKEGREMMMKDEKDDEGEGIVSLFVPHPFFFFKDHKRKRGVQVGEGEQEVSSQR